ncbi:MAG: hypothetical protein H6595_09745 [Flavobacteriales bacterium]|nr:hypothetical protein [Flavobacteriales bacterium]MCB9167743.1 hypothetical protein [Flavobacteriales bacterium]
MRNLLFRSALVAVVLIGGQARAQNVCDTIANICSKHITQEYIPDGQFYRALLYQDEIAEFDMTLFGGITYRIAACTGLSDGALQFSVYDKQHNLLFTNREHDNDPYWDLAVANTIDVSVEAQLDRTKAGSGCAVLLIGFKQ